MPSRSRRGRLRPLERTPAQRRKLVRRHLLRQVGPDVHVSAAAWRYLMHLAGWPL